MIASSHRNAQFENDSRRRVLVGVWCVLIILWVGFATFIVPGLIKSAYRGESLPALNGIIEQGFSWPVDKYLQLWDQIAVRMTMAGLAGLLIAAITSSRTFFQKYVGEATPGALGAIRMLTCGVLLITTTWEDLAGVALVPAEMRRGAGTMGLLFALPIGLERLVANADALRALQHVTELLLFLGMIGWLTRIVVPLAALAHFVALGILVDYSFFWHQGLVPLYLLGVLSFTPCGDGCSVDRLWKLYRGRAVPQGAAAVYGWSRYICWVVIVLPYVQSGLSKLRIAGMSWWDASNMRAMLYLDTLMPREYDWQLSLRLTSAPDMLFTLLGITTIVLEVSYILVLFSRTARRIFPWLMVATHLGILVLQRILFLDLIVLQLAFLDFTGIRRAIERRLATHHRQIASLGQLVNARIARCRAWLAARDASRAIEDGRLPARTIRVGRGAGFGFAVTLSGLVAVTVACYLQRVEFYPLTAWHLYAMLETSGKIKYYKVIGRYESGDVSNVRLEDGIGAFALDARYQVALDKCFGNPVDVTVCERFLIANGSAHNRRRQPGNRLTHYEIETWTWDFVSSPRDPEYGQFVNRLVVDLTKGQPAPQKARTH